MHLKNVKTAESRTLWLHALESYFGKLSEGIISDYLSNKEITIYLVEMCKKGSPDLVH